MWQNDLIPDDVYCKCNKVLKEYFIKAAKFFEPAFFANNV